MACAKHVLTLLVGLLLVVAACARHKDMILEYRDVQFFDVLEKNNDSLEISGLVFHSSLGVKRVEKISIDKEINVSIYLERAGKGAQGDFKIFLDMPASVEVVTFGQERIRIWKRGEGVIAPKMP